MTELMWVRSHVRQVMTAVWQTCCVEVDCDGDIPFRCGTGIGWVSVPDVPAPVVRVFAHAARGVPSSAKLLRELNEIQRGCNTARIDYADNTVVVVQTISPVGLTAPVLEQAVSSVSSVANDIGGLIVAMFGGGTPFEAEEEEVDEDASGPF